MIQIFTTIVWLFGGPQFPKALHKHWGVVLGALGGFVGGSVALTGEKRGWVPPLQAGQGGQLLVQHRYAP